MNPKGLTALMLMMWMVVGWASPTQLTRVIEAMMTYEPSILPPMIRLQLDDSPPAHFLLAPSYPGAILLDRSRLANLRVSSDSLAQDGTISFDELRFADELSAQPTTIELDNLPIPTANLNLPKFGGDREPVGIIGARFFALFPMELDFTAKQVAIVVIPDNNTPKDYVRIPLQRISDQHPVFALPMMFPAEQRVLMQFNLSTFETILSKQDFQHTEIVRFNPTPLLRGTVRSAGHTERYGYLGLVEQVSFGEFQLPSVPVLIMDETSYVGLDILSLFGTIILDFQSGSLLVRRPTSPLRVPIPGASGVELQLDGDGAIRVGEVVSGMAGERAGFRTGDEILTIKGRPVRGYPISLASQMLSDYAGMPVMVRIRRDKEEKQLVLIPDNPFGSLGIAGSKPDEDDYGFSVWAYVYESQPALVVVGASKRARKVGLRVGDIITAINGRAIADWASADEMMKALSESERYVLRVVRFGDTKEREIVVEQGKNSTSDSNSKL